MGDQSNVMGFFQPGKWRRLSTPQSTQNKLFSPVPLAALVGSRLVIHLMDLSPCFQLALQNSPPYSEIFVFTDASAKDAHLKNNVEALIQEQKCKVGAGFSLLMGLEFQTFVWFLIDAKAFSL